MDLQPNLTSIILELSQLSPLFSLKEESIYISSLLYLFQTPEQFTHSNVPLKVLKLLEHKYSICTVNRYNAPETTLINHEALYSLDPFIHPGMLFLQFSPNPNTTQWIKQSFSPHDCIITTASLFRFRFSLEIIFTHLHTTKLNTCSFVPQSVIGEFLSSSDLEDRDQTSQFFTSLTRILKLFSPEALILLLNSNRNGDVLLDAIITSLVIKHASLYSSLIQCLVTLLDKLNYHIWKYTAGDLTFITNLIVSPCLLNTLDEWNAAPDSSDNIPLGDVIFSWCEPFYSCITNSRTFTKQYKTIFKWLTYLSHYASTNSPPHSYTQLTFIDILLETLPQPSFLSSSSLACASGCLFSKLLLNAFGGNLLDLLLSTKEDWLPLFLSIRTAFFNQQTAAVHSQLSFKYFQRDNRFNISTGEQNDASHLKVFRLCHELIVKVFNSGLEYSLPSAESIVALCKQKQPINKVGTKIASLLKELKDYHDEETSKASILIDLVGDDVDSEPRFEEVYYTVSSTDRQAKKSTPLQFGSTSTSSRSDLEGEKECINEDGLVFDFPSVNSPTRVKRSGVKDRDFAKKATNLLNMETNVLVSTPDTTVPDSADNIHGSPVIAPAALLSPVSSFDSEPTRDTNDVTHHGNNVKAQSDRISPPYNPSFPQLQVSYKANLNNEADRAEGANLRKRKHSPSKSTPSEKRSLKIQIDLKHLNRVPRVNSLNPISKQSITQLVQPHTSTPVNNNSNIKPAFKLQQHDVNNNSSTPLTSNNNKDKPIFDISAPPKIPTDLQANDSSTDLKLEVSNIGKQPTEFVFVENISTTSTQNYDRLKEDLYLSQITPDENEESPIKKKPKEPTHKKYNPVSSSSVKRKKTNVTTMRPPFSRSRLTTMTDATPEPKVDYSKPATLYKNPKQPKKPHTPSPPVSKLHQYPTNIVLDLPEINASPNEIRSMNDKAKLKLQPCEIRQAPDSLPAQHKSYSKPTSVKNRASITQHAPNVIIKPTSKIPPEEHIDNILAWSPDIFLRDGAGPRDTPPIHAPSPLPLSYKSFDEYKHLFSTCLLHEIFSNLGEEIEKIESIPYHEYSAVGQHLYPYKEEGRPIVGLFNLKTPQNDSSFFDFVKEQDLVLIKIKASAPDAINDVMLFGYIDKVKVDKPDQLKDECAPHQRTKRFVSKVSLTIKYDTRHIMSHFTQVSLKPLISLTTYNRQWRGLINLYKSPICPYILYPSFRICDPHISSIGKILIPNDNLFNESQRRAITRIASMVSEPFACPKIALLLGPPGCGKSHTITGLLSTVLKMVSSDRREQHILLCAPSNASADELALKLLERHLISVHNKFGRITRSILQDTYGSNAVPRINQEETSSAEEHISLIRLGQLEQVHLSVKPFHIDSLVSSARQQCVSKMSGNLREHESSKVKLEFDIKQLENDIQGLKLQCETFTDDRVARSELRDSEVNLKSLQNKRINVKREITRLESIHQKSKLTDKRIKESLLKNTNIILTTLSSSGISMMEELFKDDKDKLNHFSCVIVDEATQCNELDILIPLQFMSTKLVLVGDPNQLPAVVKSPQLQGNGFGRSLFERFDLFFNQDRNSRDPVIRLDTQYRMHPEICHFPKQAFYKGQLRTFRKIEMRSNELLRPYLLFHISYGQEISSKPGQIVNIKEIEFVSALVKELLKKFDASSIGIITPYQAQLRELTKAISQFSEKIDINSVDGFQGKEKDIIIISCVRSKSKTGTIGFLSNYKRINVALTRAKKALYIVGDVDSLTRNQTWSKLIEDAESREKLLTIDSSHIDESARQIWLPGMCDD